MRTVSRRRVTARGARMSASWWRPTRDHRRRRRGRAAQTWGRADEVDALQGIGPSLTAHLRKLFGREHWTRTE